MGAWAEVADAREPVELLLWDVWETVDVGADVLVLMLVLDVLVLVLDVAFEELDVLDTLCEVEDGALVVVCEAEVVGRFVLVLARP